VQGIGGAMTSAVVLGMIVTMFPEPREQAKAIGVLSFVAAAGASIGLLLGGVLTQGVNWHWIFFVNVPIGIVTAVLAVRLLELDHGLGLRAGADAIGAVLVTAALMLGVYTIVEVERYDWLSLHTLGLGAVSLLLLAAFTVRQSRAETPLLPLRILRSRNVTGANLVLVLMVSGLFGMFFLGVLYMQRVLGYDAVETGFAFLPVSLGIGLMSLGFSARLNERFGPRAVLLTGLTLSGLALAWMARVPGGAIYALDILPSMALLGAGAGVSFPALMTLAMSGATEEDAGLASGLVNTTQQLGAALGLAILVTLATTRTDALRSAGDSQTTALASGYRLGFAVAAGLLAAAVALGAAVLQSERAARLSVARAAPQRRLSREAA
jgi:MFS family permease